MCKCCVPHNYSKDTKIKYDALYRYHCDNGPAIIDGNIKEWWIHGKRHRTDGPAIIKIINHWLYGEIFTYFEWFFDGKKVLCSTPSDFHSLMRMKVFW